ncbi:MAG: triphosphoribosyl-dephospho-CoA synthase [Pirellulales bacterium]
MLGRTRSMIPFGQSWSIAQAAGLATLLEASAPKYGNVHPSACFDDMHFGHFVASAAVQQSCFESIGSSVGDLVLRTVRETRYRVGRNTNLGTVLLLAPLAIAANAIEAEELGHATLAAVTARVLGDLTAQDSSLVYEAIRVASPGGLGQQSENDVSSAVAPESLVAAMQQVAEVDSVARQYTNGFVEVFDPLLGWLDEELSKQADPLIAIQRFQLRCLAWQPDGLIIRKCGFDQAVKVQQMAKELHHRCVQSDPNSEVNSRQFDQYLRADRNRRNPGTTR